MTMRIAMFTNNYKPYIGGVPVSIEHLSDALREQGHQVWVFAPSYKDQEEEPYVVRYPSFPVSVVGAPVPNILTKLFERKVKELGIDVIHVHHPAIVGNVALMLKRKLHIPVVFTYHTRYEEYLHYIAGLKKIEDCTGMIDKYLRYFCRKCDLLIAPTPGICAYLQEKEMDMPVAVLPTGIPMDSFLPEKEKAERMRKEYIGSADYLFCTVSRLAKEKNLYFQLEGLVCLKRLLKKSGKSFRHLMIGDGPEREKFENRIRELGLDREVILVGNVPNTAIKNYQAASDLFLFTSKSETQGIVLLEAMAASNPVIAVTASGVCDVVKNGENGYMTSEDSFRWAKKITDVLGNPEELAAMRAGARRTAEAYSEETVAARAVLCYEKVCTKTPEETPARISLFHHSVV